MANGTQEKVYTRSPNATLKLFVATEPEFKYVGEKNTPFWSARAAFQAAYRERQKDPKAAGLWFGLKAWNKLASAIAELDIKKGDLLLVAGDFEVENYEKDGEARQSLVLVVSEVSKVVRVKKDDDAASKPVKKAEALPDFEDEAF